MLALYPLPGKMTLKHCFSQITELFDEYIVEMIWSFLIVYVPNGMKSMGLM